MDVMWWEWGEGRGVEGQEGGGSEWEKKEKKQKQKNYRRHIPSRSGLVKTHYVNRGVEESKNLCKAQINTLIKSHARVKKEKRALISSIRAPYSARLSMNYLNFY